MYLPRTFTVNNLSVLHELMETHRFATIYSQSGGESIASHLPFMVDRSRGEHGTLIAHFARANKHWKHFEEEAGALVVFQGPHAYISPAWYEDQVTVPTWNYAVVHAYGQPALIHEPGPLREMVLRLVGVHEGPADSDWDVEMAGPVMERELKAIVGFEIEIERIEGKFKFNQNRSKADQAGVARHLSRSADPSEQAVSRIMLENVKAKQADAGQPAEVGASLAGNFTAEPGAGVKADSPENSRRDGE